MSEERAHETLVYWGQALKLEFKHPLSDVYPKFNKKQPFIGDDWRFTRKGLDYLFDKLTKKE